MWNTFAYFLSGNKDNAIVSVVKRAIIIRLVILIFIIAVDQFIEDYDTSTEMIDRELGYSSMIDLYTREILRPFSHWDALYFTDVGIHLSYAYEHMHAFFPGLPIFIYFFSFCIGSIQHVIEQIIGWNMDSIFTERARALLCGVLINQVAFLKGAVELYKLTKLLFNSKLMAYTSSMMFALSPATIFLCVIYSESLYACFTFWGLRILMECLHENRIHYQGGVKEFCKLFKSGILLSITVGIRSTGFLYGIFYAYYFLVRFPWKQILLNNRHEIFKKEIIIVFFTFVLNSIILVAPMFIYQYYAYSIYCIDSNPNIDMSPWCQDNLPNVYKYVQARYWNVGLFKYYEFHQIPNFLLAGPMLIVSTGSLIYFFAPYLKLSYSRNMDHIPFFLHWGILTAVAYTVLHIQVVTRFMSATPPLYWMLASLVLTKNGFKHSLFFNQSIFTFVTFVYCLAYIVIGCVLHSNFYPWT